MRFPIALAMALFPTLAAANCLPPWQTHFACDLPERNARAEFCRIAKPQQHPGVPEHYYSFVRGTQPAELYFQTDSYWFTTKDVDVNHPSSFRVGVGYARGNTVYAFFVNQRHSDQRIVGDAEVRVYESTDAFSSSTRDNEQLRLRCAPGSVVADTAAIAP
jgi:hypothetical protein